MNATPNILDVPSVDELVEELKRLHPDPKKYVTDLCWSSGSRNKKYEEKILKTAKALHESRKQKAEAQKLELERLREIVLRLESYGSNADFLDLTEEDQLLLPKMYSALDEKPLDEWYEEEKAIYRFWHKLPKIYFENTLDAPVDQQPRILKELRSISLSLKVIIMLAFGIPMIVYGLRGCLLNN
jgi:hypothetical protein